MKFHFIFHFIQTAKQEEEGLWIGLFFLIVIIIFAIWAQLQPEEDENTSYTPAGFDKSSYDMEKRLKSYLDSPWLMWEGLIIEVKKTNPRLARIANQKFKEYNDKKEQNNSSEGSTDDEIVVTFEVDVTEGNQKKKRSRRISQDVKDKVWRRDEGKCVECSSNENLEFDHIIPHSKGGANTYRNIQLLCEKCNRSKSAKIG